jgi:hypothetical protein
MRIVIICVSIVRLKHKFFNCVSFTLEVQLLALNSKGMRKLGETAYKLQDEPFFKYIRGDAQLFHGHDTFAKSLLSDD